ncbi:MAG: YdcF family protein [bacterium]|nr:YdcF family protein [bacterium]
MKVLGALFAPPALIAVGLVAALVFRRRRPRWGAAALAMALVVYFLLATEPFSYALAWTLEHRYRVQPTPAALADVQVIVVLAGGASKGTALQPLAELSGASWRRLWRGIELHRALGGTVPILYVGGSGDPFDPVSTEAALARSYAVTMGVPVDQFWIEDTSRSTFENGRAADAVFVERLPGAHERRIALVTSARHLPRAMAVFRKIGITSIPVAADIATGEFQLDLLDVLPSASAFASSMSSIHEWVGMFGYRMLGRI